MVDHYTTTISKAKYEAKHEKGLKILTPKQMLQRLPMTLAGITFENLLGEIRPIIYCLYQAKQITEKAYNNIMNPINLQSRIDIHYIYEF